MTKVGIPQAARPQLRLEDITRRQAERHSAGKPKCTVLQALNKLSDADRRTMMTALASLDEYTNSVLAEVLSELSGTTVKGHTIGRHRRRVDGKGCSCPPDARIHELLAKKAVA